MSYQITSSSLDFKHIGWKYYNSIVKKAVEQEFSWSGFFISLSIAFFIVIIMAMSLNIAYQSIQKVDKYQRYFQIGAAENQQSIDLSDKIFINLA